MKPYYFTHCGNCKQFKATKNPDKYDWQGRCKKLGVKRNIDSDSCNKVEPIDKFKATVGNGNDEKERYGDDW